MIKSRISGCLLGIIPKETRRRLGVLLGGQISVMVKEDPDNR